MRYFTLFFATALLWLIIGGCNSNRNNGSVKLDINAAAFEKISEYAFFKDCTGFTQPNKGVIPFKLVNAMFNDYSLRDCFLYIPEGGTFSFDSSNLLNLPQGSCLINVVYYWKDARNISLGKQLVETQMLVNKPTGWDALTYHWTADQKDAVLTDNGGSNAVNFIDKKGGVHQLNFVTPSRDECKSCHLLINKITPIGVTAANLNMDVTDSTGKKNQLGRWIDAGLLKNFSLSSVPLPVSYEDTTKPLEPRARAYLNANCAHCHCPNGPAYVSGLLLNADNNNSFTLGICKPPLAKGHGTCNLNYDIVPGKPAESIVIGRLSSAEFGVKMPETGRTLVDTAGVLLISQWISQLKGECR